jgi:hypothetical protein
MRVGGFAAFVVVGSAPHCRLCSRRRRILRSIPVGCKFQKNPYRFYLADGVSQSFFLRKKVGFVFFASLHPAIEGLCFVLDRRRIKQNDRWILRSISVL